MTLYLLEEKERSIYIYGREKQEIVETVRCVQDFVQQELNAELDDPRVPNVFHEIPSIDDIPETETGELKFQVGGIDFSSGLEEAFFEVLQITPDFKVLINKESVLSFQSLQATILTQQKGPLYEIRVPSMLFGSLTYVPKDIAKAIQNYDVTELFKRAEPGLKERYQMMVEHPNLNPSSAAETQFAEVDEEPN